MNSTGLIARKPASALNFRKTEHHSPKLKAAGSSPAGRTKSPDRLRRRTHCARLPVGSCCPKPHRAAAVPFLSYPCNIQLQVIAERIGRYRIVRLLGSGGFGEVYLVEDPNLQRLVALKILPQADEKAKRRFVREAITASKLSHPNVAVVYEAGEADGTAFIAMQYVEGETLREKLRHGPLPVQEAVRIAGEVADALDDAHKH